MPIVPFPEKGPLGLVDPYSLLTEQDREEVRSMGLTPWPNASLATGQGASFALTSKGRQTFRLAQQHFACLAQLEEPATLKAWKQAASLTGAAVRAPVLQALERQLQSGHLEPQYRDYARATLYGTWAQRRKALGKLLLALRGGANVIPLSFHQRHAPK